MSDGRVTEFVLLILWTAFAYKCGLNDGRRAAMQRLLRWCVPDCAVWYPWFMESMS